ncbi:MAG: GAF domain-containing protein [Caldilineaceae bacterium]|nr:GAF domain-containing protein [Caldilineaceae bacterium]
MPYRLGTLRHVEDANLNGAAQARLDRTRIGWYRLENPMSFSEQKTHIFIVENDVEQIQRIQQAFQLHSDRIELMIAVNLAEARALLAAVVPDLMVVNWFLPDGEGAELLPLVHKSLLQAIPALAGQFRRKPIYPVIFLGQAGSEHLALASVRAGALDYIIKTAENLQKLPHIAEQALQEWDDLVLREQAEEATRTELARAELFYSTAHALVSLDSPTKKLQTIVDNIAEALPASLVSLNVLDLTKRQIMETVVGGLNAEPFTPPTFDDLWDGLVGWSLRKLEPVVSPKNANDVRERLEARQKRLDRQIGSLMVTPLVYRGRTLGVMCAHNRLDERNFTRTNLSLLVALAHQAAIVVEEARMLQEKNALVQQIQEQISRTERIMDAIPEGVILLNHQRRVIQVNAMGREYLKYLGNTNVGEVLYSLNAIPIYTLLRRPNRTAHNKVNISIDRHRHLEICACPVNHIDSHEETTQEATVSLATTRAEWPEPEEWLVLIRDISEYVATQQEQSTVAAPSLAAYATQVASSIARSWRNDPG